MARIAMAKKYNVDDFQFSQAYPMFYDHLNKANELRRLYKHTKNVALQTANLSQAEAITAAVHACRARKEEQLSGVYTIITMCLGTPPSATEKYTYEFYDKKGQYQSFEMSPLELYADLAPAFKPQDTISLVNQPNHELGKLYTVERSQNVVGGKKTEYVNMQIEDLEQAVIKMIKADEPVWFACDSRSNGDTNKGIWDVNVRDIEGAFGTALGMNKAERLDTGASAPTHAMMISGVHVEDGKPVRYRIENSWGAERGEKGYFVCSAAWFREYTYEVIVNKKLAPPAAVKIFEAGNPTMLPPWSTMAQKAK